MAVKKITEEYFDDVKRSLERKRRWTRFTSRHIKKVAETHGISYKTVVQIEASNDYEAYRRQVVAQHPITHYSLAEDIISLHGELFGEREKYTKPKAASQAVAQIRYELVTRPKYEKPIKDAQRRGEGSYGS